MRGFRKLYLRVCTQDVRISLGAKTPSLWQVAKAGVIVSKIFGHTKFTVLPSKTFTMAGSGSTVTPLGTVGAVVHTENKCRRKTI